MVFTLYWYYGTAFIVGCMIASFLNVVAARGALIIERDWLCDVREWFEHKGWAFPPEAGEFIREHQKLSLSFPSSHCFACKQPIKPWHNVPVLGWIALRGKCASCGCKISPKYPLGEAAGGLLALLAAWKFGMGLPAAAAFFFLAVLMALALTDFECKILPDRYNGLLALSGLACSALGLTPVSASASIWGLAAGFLSLEALRIAAKALLKRDGMGAGDPKLFGAIGAWIGPAALIPAALGASVFGLALAAFWMKAHKGQDPQIPFGPSLALGGYCALLWHSQLIALMAAR